MTQQSNKPKFYYFIPAISESCRSSFIFHLYDTFIPGGRFITTGHWDNNQDKLYMEDWLSERMEWKCDRTQFKGLPEDNMIFTQNIGDKQCNTLTHYQLIIYMDMDYLPVIQEAIKKAQERAKEINIPVDNKVVVPVVHTCDPKSDEPMKNPIRFFYNNYKVQYPNVEWFL
jgi:hypothetical protein